VQPDLTSRYNGSLAGIAPIEIFYKIHQDLMDPQQLDLPTEFASERIFLRAYRPGDGALYFRVIRENWDHLYEFLPAILESMQNEADAEAVIRWMNSEWQQHNLFIFGIWEKASGDYIGEIYLANPDWHVPSVELGYFVVRASTGKGFASEAARAMLRYAFEQMQVSRVDLQCRMDNEASQRVAERCGFRLEGRQRLRHRKKDGVLVDRLWYGLLLSEWQEGLAK
jgi:ribosomal-protein-serine acetyltransferase